MEPAARHDYSFKSLLHAGVTDQPSVVISLQEFDSSFEPDARRNAERLGIAVQVIQMSRFDG